MNYLSLLTPNKVTITAATYVTNQIVNEIAGAAFFSIIVDTKQDILKTDQFSFTIRYVSANFNKIICINESFLGFVAIRNDSSAEYIKLQL